MNTQQKGLAALGAAAVIFGGIILSTNVVKAAPRPNQATVSIVVYDSNGNPVPHNSPYSLNEGSTYTVKATITNTSTKGGVATAATMTFSMVGTSSKKTYMPTVTQTYNFPAGGSLVVTGTLTSAIGDAPDTGVIAATLDDPSGNLIASASNAFTIVALPIVYGGTIAFS